MNAYNQNPRAAFIRCPKCGMYRGKRKESVNLPELYYMRCYRCGYIVAGDIRVLPSTTATAGGHSDDERH